jgi:hypothetical protein
MNTQNSFTAGMDDRTEAGTMTVLTGGSVGSLSGATRPFYFHARALSGSPIPEMEPSHEVAPQAPRSNGWMSRVIGPATAKCEGFAITVNGRDTIGVIVAVDRERGVAGWRSIGEFTGSFVMIGDTTADRSF